ncbi:acyl-CoA thioesterase [Staphylospora marina]|uniref:acyl-CoA thioesterase n=1 Tax=Staphylospora marina TaxID=2490858 RepID=UPI000F5BF0E5|nr:thioesterase family protein [Staphylospora marina]
MQTIQPTWSESHLRVRYQETDQMGVVYHSNYLIWFEVGRTDWIRQFGHSYREFEEKGLLLPVVEVYCKYIRPARYDDEVIVRTRLGEFGGSKLEFRYEVNRKQDGQLLVTGRSVHLWVDKNMKRTSIKQVFPELYAKLKQMASESGE